MKEDGVHGDFIVYEKPQDRECSIRISFMKQEMNSESTKCKAQKVKLRRTKTENNGGPGYGLDSTTFMKWFDTMPMLIDYYKNDPVHPFKRPYFYSGTKDPDSSPLSHRSTASSTDAIDSTGYTDPNITEEFSETMRRTASERDTVEEPPPLTDPTLESPIIYNHPKAKSLLNGKPAGTYLIHQDDKRNTEAKPYTIYAIQTSRRTGDNRCSSASIFFHEDTNTYSIGSEAKAFRSIDELLEAHGEFLRFNVKFDRPHYVDYKDIPESKDSHHQMKSTAEENPYVENYRRYTY